MNKKGVLPAAGPIAMVLAVFIGIMLLIFLGGGGLSSAFDLTRLLKSVIDILTEIPVFIWVILGILYLVRLLQRK